MSHLQLIIVNIHLRISGYFIINFYGIQYFACFAWIIFWSCIKIKILILFFEHSQYWQSFCPPDNGYDIHGCSNSHQWQWHSSSFCISLAFALQIMSSNYHSTLIPAPYSSLCWYFSISSNNLYIVQVHISYQHLLVLLHTIIVCSFYFCRSMSI